MKLPEMMVLYKCIFLKTLKPFLYWKTILFLVFQYHTNVNPSHICNIEHNWMEEIEQNQKPKKHKICKSFLTSKRKAGEQHQQIEEFPVSILYS